jgi:hypothetical protein
MPFGIRKEHFRLFALAVIERDRLKFYVEQGKFCRHSQSYGEKFNTVQHKNFRS